jgi:hypothetical protein
MKKIALSLIAVGAIVSTNSFAADSLEGAFKEGTVSGQIRAFYINRSYDFSTGSNYSRDGLALGGKLSYETAPLYGISAGVALYTTNKIDDRSSTTTENDLTLFRKGSSGYPEGTTYLGQAYLQGKYGKTTVKMGRQQLDTPLAGSDDARELPNLFTAAVVINTDLPDTTLIGARVTQIAYGSFANGYGGGELALVSGYGNSYASYGNNYETGTFKSMGQAALGVSAKNTGVTAAAAINKSIKGLTLQAWDYNAEDILNAIYAQADYSWKCLLNPNATMTASVQYIKENNLHPTLKLDSAPYYGVQLSSKVGSFNAAVAYSETGKDSGATFGGDVITPWGGMPAFTQGMVTRHQFFADTNSWKVSGGYNLKEAFGQDITASAYYSSFDVGTANTYTVKGTTTEPGFDIIYNNAGIKNLQLRLRGNFPNDFQKTAAGKTTTWSEYRVIANYNF